MPKVMTLVSGKGRIQRRQPVSETHSILPPLIMIISFNNHNLLGHQLFQFSPQQPREGDNINSQFIVGMGN